VNRQIRCRFVVLIASVLLGNWSAQAQQDPPAAAFRSLPLESNLAGSGIENKVEDLLKQMTQEEKIGQLVQYSAGTPTGPGTGRGLEEIVSLPLMMILPGLLLGACGGVRCTASKKLLVLAGVACL
jgi:hypothetical protein